MSESISRDHENDQPVIDTDVHIELPSGKCEVFVSKSGSISRGHENDLISRQAAIDEVVAWLKDCMTDKKNGKPLTDRLKDLPSAQPELAQDLPNACTDAISRQAAINALREEFKKSPTTAIRAMSAIKILPSAQPERTCETCRYNNRTWDMEPCDSCTIGGKDSHYEPSAQPEIIHCRDCKWHNEEINQCNAQICASMCGEDFCSRAERREE